MLNSVYIKILYILKFCYSYISVILSMYNIMKILFNYAENITLFKFISLFLQ
jgi:hypothetical protein